MNVWYQVNKSRIEKLMHELEEFKLSGSSDGRMNFGEVLFLFSGLVHENKILTMKVLELTTMLENKNKTN